MKELPSIEKPLLLRTDFSDDVAWTSLCEAVQQPTEDGFKASVEFISDLAYDGLTVEQLMALGPKGVQCGRHTVAFTADQQTFTNSERPVLVVDLYDQPGRTFRVIPCQMWSVENNLSIANMSFAEFADSAGAGGVFRGFPRV